MIQVGTYLRVADNTGAKRALCINIPGASRQHYAWAGDLITAVVKGADPRGAVQDAQIVKGVVVRTKKERRRSDGSYVRFDDNAVVLVSKEGDPLGTRILGPVAREVRDRGYHKVASLAPEVI